LSTSYLLLTLFFSLAGLGFFLYGKKQIAIVPMLCGVGLMIYPYFFSNVLVLSAIGIVLMALPYFLEL